MKIIVRTSVHIYESGVDWTVNDQQVADDLDQPTAGAAVSDAVDALAARVRTQVDARFGDQPSVEDTP